MRLYIMTDLEAVAGVVSSVDYCFPHSRYYETGKELLTLEVNAAIDGALEAGVTEVLVCDGHGWGAIDPAKLHPRAELLTGRPFDYPMGLERGFDIAFMIGQHAKANTDGGHLCHSGSFVVIDESINGRSVGEIGVVALVMGHYDVPLVFLSGDAAGAAEARELIRGIETVVVKEGIKRGLPPDTLTTEQTRVFNGAAIHLHPTVARERIRAGAKRAIDRRDQVRPLKFEPPYEVRRIDRPSDDGRPGRRLRKTGSDLIALLNGGWDEEAPGGE